MIHGELPLRSGSSEFLEEQQLTPGQSAVLLSTLPLACRTALSPLSRCPKSQRMAMLKHPFSATGHQNWPL